MRTHGLIKTMVLNCIIIIYPLFAQAQSNRYTVHYCYATNTGYTSWKHVSGKAIGGTDSSGKMFVNFYWFLNDKVCFSLKMNDMDIYRMSKKEIKQRVKEKKPFKGTGIVGYYTYSGRFNFEKFPGGDAFPSGSSSSPKGQWITENANFEYSQFEDHLLIQVSFDGYQFSVALTACYFYD